MTPGNFDDYKAELRQSLLDDYSRRYGSHRRRSITRSAAAALVVVALTAGVIASSGDEADAGVRVVVADGFVSVLIEDVEANPEEIESAAQLHGLDLEVDTAPVGPSMVGRFLSQTGDQPIPPEFSVIDGDGKSSAGFRLPVTWDGRLRIVVGRAAENGEEWRVPSNALAPNEPLACMDLLGQALDDVVRRLADESIDVRVFVMDGGATEVDPELLGDYATWPVSDLSALSASEVIVDASRDGRSFTDGEFPTMPNGC